MVNNRKPLLFLTVLIKYPIKYPSSKLVIFLLLEKCKDFHYHALLIDLCNLNK